MRGTANGATGWLSSGCHPTDNPHTSEAQLRVEAKQDRDGSIVRVAGEIDLSTAKAFRFALVHAVQPDGTVRVDMSGVTFIDSTGLSGLVSASQAAQQVNGVVVVVAASDAVRSAITFAGLADRFLRD